MKRLVELLHGAVSAVRARFAVAHGFASNCWLRRLGGRDPVRHGFDHSTAMPNSSREGFWRAFDVGGKAPAVDDARVRCYIGGVHDTLGTIDLVTARAPSRFHFLDGSDDQVGYQSPLPFHESELRRRRRPGPRRLAAERADPLAEIGGRVADCHRTAVGAMG